MVKIYLADLNYFNAYTTHQITVPLNVGFIQSYASKIFPDVFEFRLFKDPKKLLRAIHEDAPDILGLSCYYWNTQIDKYIARFAKKHNPEVQVVVGGPQIDFKHKDMSFREEQFNLHEEFDTIPDFYILNEGELGFSTFLDRYLKVGPEKVFDEPINGGVHFINDKDYIAGKYLGVDLDLNELPSPILSGYLDEFLGEDYMPALQTSRLCPYTCTFCSSGKLKGKLRAFSTDRVYDEIDYIADIYKKFPYRRLYITDENFGILKRDTEIAQYLHHTKEKIGYPQGVQVYFDKKFQLNSRKTSLHLADLECDGVMLAFQSLNKETLKAIKRINLNDEEVDNIIKWAGKYNFPVSTQLILGLPYETKETFMDSIEYLLQKRVNNLSIFQCMLFKGAELNRGYEREHQGFKTKWRPCYLPSYDEFNDDFICETEEIIVSNKWMSFDDFIDLNKIGFMTYLLTTANYFGRVINYLIEFTELNITKLFDDIMSPINGEIKEGPYKKFLSDYYNERVEELSNSSFEAQQRMELSYKIANNKVDGPTRINVKFASRLIYHEKWFARILWDNIKNNNLKEEDEIIIRDLIKICEEEWINLHDVSKVKKIPISGLTHRYLGTKIDCVTNSKNKKYDIKLSVSDQQKIILESYMNKHYKKDSQEHLTNALDFIFPRTRLRYENMDCIIN